MAGKRNFTPKTKEEREKEIKNITEQTDKEVDSYFNSPEKLHEYLNYMGKFYNYSARNQKLIKGQFRAAQAVGSYEYWRKKGNPVQKGEKGIKILVPIKNEPKFRNDEGDWKSTKQATEAEKARIQSKQLRSIPAFTTFKLGSVFDISQTNTPPSDYPEMFPNRPIDGKIKNYSAIMKGLREVAANDNVKIEKPRKELGAAKGAYYPLDHVIEMNPRNTKFDNVTVLIHELAHSKMHTIDKSDNYSTSEKELQAEMVNTVVSSYMGFESENSKTNSLRYINNWTKGKTINDKTKLLEEVKQTSSDIIETLEKHLSKESLKESEKKKSQKQKETELA